MSPRRPRPSTANQHEGWDVTGSSATVGGTTNSSAVGSCAQTNGGSESVSASLLETAIAVAGGTALASPTRAASALVTIRGEAFVGGPSRSSKKRKSERSEPGSGSSGVLESYFARGRMSDIGDERVGESSASLGTQNTRSNNAADAPIVDEVNKEGSRSTGNLGSPRSIASKTMPPRAKSTTNARSQKLSFRPYKVQPTVDPKLFEDTWENVLRVAVNAVQGSRGTSYSYEELYGKVEDICRQKNAVLLYSKLEQECNLHISSQIKNLSGQYVQDEDFLRSVDRCWNDHCSQMSTIQSIFLYLDRTYVVQGGIGDRSLWNMGLRLFGGHFVQRVDVQRKSIAGVLSLIEKERNGDSVDRLLIKSLVRIFTAIDRYRDSFEKPLLDASERYYQAEGSAKIQELEVAVYLMHVENRITQENERVNFYLDPFTRKALIPCVHSTLIAPHVSVILEKGFDAICNDHRVEDLSRMYNLLRAVSDSSQDSPLMQMKASFSAYIKRVGGNMIMDTEKDADLVQSLLDFKKRLDTIVQDAFQGSESFVYALKESFEVFINMRQNTPAELIARFIDNILRTGNKGFSEEELEDNLDRVMTLFRFVRGKDIFEAFYKKYLAKRLLFQKSASHDLEKLMLEKLKMECGAVFTNKLEGMFKDVDLSKDIMASFHQHQSSVQKLKDVDLSVYVLTLSYWPPTSKVEVTLPQEVLELHEIFKTFYLSNHSGKQLTWVHSSGTCLVRALFPRGEKLLDLSLLQSVVLMLFNDTDELSYQDIRNALGMTEPELKRTLLSLASGKPTLRVLQKQPKGANVEDTDVFIYNKDFEHKLRRLKINTIQVKETKEESQQTTEKVFQERQLQIDAAVVRIMKTRRTMSHTQLISELYDQLKFPHKPADLKRRIESLIEREYLERDASNAQIYTYLA